MIAVFRIKSVLWIRIGIRILRIYLSVWIRNQIRIGNVDPDPGASELTKINK
jgi:hypothetical protein